MNKRVLTIVMVMLMVGLLTMTASAQLRVALLINGTLGDRSFFDSAANGMEIIKKELGVRTKVIEMSYDPSKWEPTLADVSDMNWDIIIVGTWQMTEYLEKIAAQHPEKKYIIFDTSVDYSKGNLDNVYSILYKQNEGSFLAGALAAMVTTSDLPLANDDKYIGFLGGMDIPVINDFLVGYIQGAKYVEPGIKVAISYIGDFADSAKGKEMALAQYNLGVDVGFNVAGQAGLGQIEAAKDAQRYAIGVDSDQALLFEENAPEKSELILTSMMKRVDNSLVRAIKLYQEGKLEFGKAEALGIKEGAVGLADNKYYQMLVTDEMRDTLSELKEKIESGEIKVESAIGMSNERLDEIRNSVRP